MKEPTEARKIIRERAADKLEILMVDVRKLEQLLTAIDGDNNIKEETAAFNACRSLLGR